MAQVNYFFSTNNTDNAKNLTPATGAAGNSPNTLNSGIGTNATYDPFELRVSTGISGAAVPTKEQVEKFLDLCHAWLYDGEVGLDALIKANAETVGIP